MQDIFVDRSTVRNRKREDIVGSEAIGALGAIMLVGVMAFFWLGRLKEKSPTGEFLEDHKIATQSTVENHYSLKLGMPEHQSQTLMPAISANESKISAAPPVAEFVEEKVVDCPNAAANLDIAAKLSKIGDFEGVREIADLVLESDEATFEQKAQARSLKRQSSTR
jgi:Tfp pilus assembly protein FimV